MKFLEETPNILKKYDNFLLGIKGLSINTIGRQNTHLVLYFRFLIKYLKLPIELEDIDEKILLGVKKKDVIAFSTYSSFTLNNSPYTVQTKICTIKVFYEWLLSITPRGYLYLNPADNILNKEKIDRKVNFLSLEQAKKLEKIFTFKNSDNPILFNTIISTFLCTGARVGELVNIKIKDLNFDNSTIRIIGKGNKERILYLNKKCKYRILFYIKQRKKNNKKLNPNDFLFVNKRNEKLSVKEVEKICKKGFKYIGLSGGYTVHTLRHTAATLMYEYSTKDIYTIKEFLGHDEISMTQRYIHLKEDDLRKSIEKNPLNI